MFPVESFGKKELFLNLKAWGHIHHVSVLWSILEAPTFPLLAEH